MVAAVRELLIPQTTVHHAQQSREDAARLSTTSDDSDDPALRGCARRILTLGCEYVLITGTHENTAAGGEHFHSQDGVVRIGQLGSACRALITGRAARWPPPSLPPIANGLAISRRCAMPQEYTWQTLGFGIPARMGQHIP